MYFFKKDKPEIINKKTEWVNLSTHSV